MQITLVNVLLASIAAVGVVPGVSGLPFNLARRVNAGVPKAARLEKVFARTDNSTSSYSNATATTTSVDSSNTTDSSVTTTDLSATTTTDASVAAQTTVYSGSTPIDSAALPSITDWNSCERFMNSEGINLFSNSFNNFDVVIEQVTVFEILIDERGRARETRTFHSFPQPTNYFSEFDLSIQTNINIEEFNSVDSSGSFFDNDGNSISDESGSGSNSHSFNSNSDEESENSISVISSL